MKKLFLLPLLLLASFAYGKESPTTTVSEKNKTEFLRIKKDANDVPIALQLANVRYVPKSGIPKGVQVDLISAVHIADQSYYKNLNEIFKNYDVVLYELVAPEGTRVGDKAASEGKSILSMFQQGMKNVLGLTFQLDEVDYAAKNFVHADISPDEFVKSMEDNGESFFSMFLKMWIAGIKQQASNPNAVSDADILVALFSGDREKNLKIIAAQQFSQMDGVMDAISGENGSTIVTTRNLKALKVLRREMERGKKTFAIFYGAAHMPEMEEVLMREFKLKKSQVNWLDAWDLK